MVFYQQWGKQVFCINTKAFCIDLLDLQITILVSFSGFITVTWGMVAEVLNINIKNNYTYDLKKKKGTMIFSLCVKTTVRRCGNLIFIFAYFAQRRIFDLANLKPFRGQEKITPLPTLGSNL